MSWLGDLISKRDEDPFGMNRKREREMEDLLLKIQQKDKRIKQLEDGTAKAIDRIEELHREIRKLKGQT